MPAPGSVEDQAVGCAARVAPGLLLGVAGMPSRDHEIYVELFRQRPQLALELLRVCGAIELPREVVELGSSDLSQVTPTEFRADAVVVVRDAARVAVAGVVIEIQISYDADKRRTWPLYLAALRARLDCPVVLLVVAPDPAIARWARQPIPLGHPGFVLEPFVVGPEQIPRVTAPGRDTLPELLVLSARTHPEAEVARAALAAIDGLPDETRQLYSSFVLTALPDLLRRVLEDEMNPEQIQTAIREMSFELGLDRGRAEGLDRGRAEGLEQGLEQGLVEGLHTAALELIRSKLGALPTNTEAQVRAVRDPDQLRALVISLGQAHDQAATHEVVARLAYGRPMP